MEAVDRTKVWAALPYNPEAPLQGKIEPRASHCHYYYYPSTKSITFNLKKEA